MFGYLTFFRVKDNPDLNHDLEVQYHFLHSITDWSTPFRDRKGGQADHLKEYMKTRLSKVCSVASYNLSPA